MNREKAHFVQCTGKAAADPPGPGGPVRPVRHRWSVRAGQPAGGRPALPTQPVGPARLSGQGRHAWIGLHSCEDPGTLVQYSCRPCQSAWLGPPCMSWTANSAKLFGSRYGIAVGPARLPCPGRHARAGLHSCKDPGMVQLLWPASAWSGSPCLGSTAYSA